MKQRFSPTAALLVLLVACGDQEVILSGERLDARGGAIPNETVNRADPLALPAPVVNAEWTHVGGNVRHQQSHVALDRELADRR